MTPDQHLPESKRAIPASLLNAMYTAPGYVKPRPPVDPGEPFDGGTIPMPTRPAPRRRGWERRVPWIAAGAATVIVGAGVVLVVLNWHAILAALKVAGLVLAVLAVASVLLNRGGESVTVTGRGLKVWRS